MSYKLQWQDCTITVTSDANLSAEVDLLKDCKTLLIHVPSGVTSSRISPMVSETSGGAYHYIYITDPATGTTFHVRSHTTTGGFFWAVNIGCSRYIKLRCMDTQGDDLTFRVAGVIGAGA